MSKILDIMNKRAAFSFELFPPKTEKGEENLLKEGGVLDKLCTYEVWSKPDSGHTAVRFVTSFATPQESVDGLLAALRRLK